MLQANNLIGFGAGGGNDPITFTLVDAVSGTTSVTMPSGILDGDVGIMASFVSDSGGSISETAPSGWTSLYGTGTLSGLFNMRFFFRILTAAESSASQSGRSAGDHDNYTHVLVLSPIGTVTTLAAFSTGVTGSSGSVSARTIDVTGQAAPAVLLGFAYGAGSNPSSNGTLPSNGTTVAQGRSDFIYEIQNTVLSSRTHGMNDTGLYNMVATLGVTPST